MLSTSIAFTDWDISDVTILRPGTVYLLQGQGVDTLVVKAEPNNIFKPTSTFKNSKLAIKAVDSKAGQVKMLAPSEIQALEDWAKYQKDVIERYNENKVSNLKVPPGAEDLIDKLKNSKNDLWYKMPLADLTDADKMLAQRLGTTSGTADKSVMKMFADGLNADGGIEQLGRIIAADMYNSNQDRFSPLGGSQKIYGSKTLKFKSIINVGNIFVVGKDTQQRMSVSGHDFIDPNTGYKDFDMSLSDVKEGYDQDWLGDYICSGKLRKAFVKNIIGDLETILCPNRKAISLRHKLSSKASSRLDAGILDGMQLIVDSVTARYSKANAKWPVGVKGRVDKFKAALA